MGAGGDDGDGRGKLHEHVKAFFLKDDHVESGKTVQSHELINITASTIGKGAFSRIRLVKVKPMNRYLTQLLPDLEASEAALNAEHNGFFAMKVVKKTEVVRLKHVDHVKNESLIHSRVLHPFLATLFHRYQDEKNIYMVMEFVQGGDLYHFIHKNQRLPNEVARFFAAQMVMAVQYLHNEHVVYRDLNPENILLDRGNYIKLVDFGLSKVMNFDDPSARTWTLCGKPEYLAPEIVQSKGHSKEVDWWALGIVIHEMLAGYPPFYDKDAFEIYKQIMTPKCLAVEAMPRHFEAQGKDLVKKLVTKERLNRIGSSKNGAEDIKKHKWYRGLNWAALYNKALAMPVSDNDGSQPLTFTPHVTEPDGTQNLAPEKVKLTSNDENSPTLEPDKDAALFNGWEYLATEADLRGGSK